MPHTDITLTRKYVSKAQRAKDLGHEFEISFSTFKRCRQRKTCGLTGLKMKDNPSIDRVDNKKGYIEGNVVGCRRDVNTLKGQIESFLGQTKDADWYTVQKLVNKTIELMEKAQ